MERFASRKNVEAALKNLGVTIPGEWLARISLYGRDAFVRLLADAVDGNAAQANALRVLAENLTEEGIGRLFACTGATDEQIATVLFVRPLRTASAITLLANPQSPKHSDAVAYLRALFTSSIADAPSSASDTKPGVPPEPGQPNEQPNPNYKSRHVYGSSYGLCFNLSSFRGKAGVMLDAAVAKGPNNYDWADAIHVWLSETEIAACFAVLRKWQPRVEFANHGQRRDKSLLMEVQGATVFVKVGERSRKTGGLRAVKMLPGDTTALAIFMMDALKACYPGIPLQEICETIRANFQTPRLANA